MLLFAKTKAYSAGAYNARVFLNKDLLKEDYDSFREKLIKELKEITDDKGNKLQTKVFKKQDIYKKDENPDCPDLTVYFDDLRWASNPDLGQEGLYSWESAVGADSAGHSRQGIFIINRPKGDLGEINIAQIAPTILKLLNVKNEITIKPIEVI